MDIFRRFHRGKAGSMVTCIYLFLAGGNKLQVFLFKLVMLLFADLKFFNIFI